MVEMRLSRPFDSLGIDSNNQLVLDLKKGIAAICLKRYPWLAMRSVTNVLFDAGAVGHFECEMLARLNALYVNSPVVLLIVR